MFSPHQSAYFAHWLSLKGKAEEALTQTIASAKVDMNPHQVEAALFALRSPLSNGVVLADEVGLGKTIEASLVLAQKWAERKRKLMLIVPATLRKQWNQELQEKFALPSVILEARNFNLERELANPFDREAIGQAAIVIVSYEFAARKAKEVGRVPWDMVVFDEAHKLRNVYKPDGAKTAKTLRDTLMGVPKILMSATPLQNSLLELFGLVSIIDPYFFGDLNSFKVRYARPRLEEEELRGLRQRLGKLVNRTLRRKVQEEGGINFTRRYSLTEDFRPTDEELQLYEQVSAYLKSDDLLAIKPNARHLVTLVIRKILASSSYALEGTLENMIGRLEKKMPLLIGLEEDFDSLDDTADSSDVDDEDSIDPEALQDEIDQLKGFKQLANDISNNAKADALLRVLGKAFELNEHLGGAHKAVIFTESVRTQTWLAGLLGRNGYAEQIVMLNGSNADSSSSRIYREWLQKHKGSSRISGSKSADMKAALVDKFREDATLMICTEAGAEGINLQFCSILINYDLPWNPQRVEQRIGRVHRYGQKHDVVVVNFINKGNRADERVFELLSEKFQLFEGVFGASDEILGSIESGVDIERRIHDIYQKCRDDAQIEAEFNALQDELKQSLAHRMQDASRSVLETFDVDVVKRLNMRREQTVHQLNDYQQMLLQLARAELPQAVFHQQRFRLEQQWYDVRWQEAEATDAQFFRPHEGLGATLIEKAKHRSLNNAVLELDYAVLDGGQFVDVRGLLGQSGELVVDKLTISSKNQRLEHLLVVACKDQGEVLSSSTAVRLLQVPGQVVSGNFAFQHEERLLAKLAENADTHYQQAEEDNARYYEEENDKLERWAEDRKVALDIRNKQLDVEIREARKAARQLPTLQEKINAKRELKRLEKERDDLVLTYHEEKKKIEADEDRLLDEAAAMLELSASRERLLTVRWILKENP
jgi:ERCC4-related helicase